MTIITSQEELDEMTQQGEQDFELWNTYTLKEVYEHVYSKKPTKQFAWNK